MDTNHSTDRLDNTDGLQNNRVLLRAATSHPTPTSPALISEVVCFSILMIEGKSSLSIHTHRYNTTRGENTPGRERRKDKEGGGRRVMRGKMEEISIITRESLRESVSPLSYFITRCRDASNH